MSTPSHLLLLPPLLSHLRTLYPPSPSLPPPNPQVAQQLQADLQNFQATAEAWGVVGELLGVDYVDDYEGFTDDDGGERAFGKKKKPRYEVPIRFFAAHTICRKLQRNDEWEQLLLLSSSSSSSSASTSTNKNNVDGDGEDEDEGAGEGMSSTVREFKQALLGWCRESGEIGYPNTMINTGQGHNSNSNSNRRERGRGRRIERRRRRGSGMMDDDDENDNQDEDDGGEDEDEEDEEKDLGDKGERTVLRKLASAIAYLSLRLVPTRPHSQWPNWILEVITTIAAPSSPQPTLLPSSQKDSPSTPFSNTTTTAQQFSTQQPTDGSTSTPAARKIQGPSPRAILEVLAIVIEEVCGGGGLGKAGLVGGERLQYDSTIRSSLPILTQTLAQSLTSPSALERSWCSKCLEVMLGGRVLGWDSLVTLYPLLLPLLLHPLTLPTTASCLEEFLATSTAPAIFSSSSDQGLPSNLMGGGGQSNFMGPKRTTELLEFFAENEEIRYFLALEELPKRLKVKGKKRFRAHTRLRSLATTTGDEEAEIARGIEKAMDEMDDDDSLNLDLDPPDETALQIRKSIARLLCSLLEHAISSSSPVFSRSAKDGIPPLWSGTMRKLVAGWPMAESGGTGEKGWLVKYVLGGGSKRGGLEVNGPLGGRGVSNSYGSETFPVQWDGWEDDSEDITDYGFMTLSELKDYWSKRIESGGMGNGLAWGDDRGTRGWEEEEWEVRGTREGTGGWEEVKGYGGSQGIRVKFKTGPNGEEIEEEVEDPFGDGNGKGKGKEKPSGVVEEEKMLIRAVMKDWVGIARAKVKWVRGGMARWPRDVIERFRSFRSDVSEALCYAYYVLREDMLSDLVDTAKKQLAEANRNPNVGWEDIETTLFIINSIEEEINLSSPSETAYLLRVFGPTILGSIPQDIPFPGTAGLEEWQVESLFRLKRTALSLIGTYSVYFGDNPTLALPAVSFVVPCLSPPQSSQPQLNSQQHQWYQNLQAGLCSSAARALSKLCDSCRHELVKHLGDFARLVGEVEGKVPQGEFSTVLESVAKVMQVLPPNQQIEHVLALANPMVGRLNQAISGAAQHPEAARAVGLAQISSLTSITLGISSPDSSLDSSFIDLSSEDDGDIRPSAQNGPGQEDPRIKEVQGVMNQVIHSAVRTWMDDVEFSVALATLVKALVPPPPPPPTSQPTSSSIPLPTAIPLPALSLDSEAAATIVAEAIQRTASPIWFGTMAIIVGRVPRRFSSPPTTISIEQLQELHQWALASSTGDGRGENALLMRIVMETTLRGLDLLGKEDATSTEPDLLKGFVDFAQQVITFHPLCFLPSPPNLHNPSSPPLHSHLTSLSLHVLANPSTTERLAITSTLDLLTKLVREPTLAMEILLGGVTGIAALSNGQKGGVSGRGQEIIWGLVKAIVGIGSPNAGAGLGPGAGAVPRSSLGGVAECLMAIMKGPAGFGFAALQQQVSQVHPPSDLGMGGKPPGGPGPAAEWVRLATEELAITAGIGEKERAKFVKTVHTARMSRRVRDAVNELAVVARGLGGTAYGALTI